LRPSLSAPTVCAHAPPPHLPRSRLVVSALEPIAVAFGIVSVWLSVKENIWSWPTAIVNVLLYFVIFRDQRLYADMSLQLFYAGISAYGWYHWLFGGAQHSRLKVSRTPRRLRWILPLVVVVFAVTLGTLLRRYTNAALPYVDATLTSGSLAAQWMMSRKYLENWAVWVTLDVAYVTVFINRGLLLTAFLYGVFHILAARGHVEWSRSLRRTLAGEPEPGSDPGPDVEPQPGV
jgi:nicotinamide mononucleotide transporter